MTFGAVRLNNICETVNNYRQHHKEKGFEVNDKVNGELDKIIADKKAITESLISPPDIKHPHIKIAFISCPQWPFQKLQLHLQRVFEGLCRPHQR